MKVSPYLLEANGLMNPFTNKKTWRITCGTCRHTYDDKVPHVEECSSLCSSCGDQNFWLLSAFERYYEKVIGS